MEVNDNHYLVFDNDYCLINFLIINAFYFQKND